MKSPDTSLKTRCVGAFFLPVFITKDSQRWDASAYSISLFFGRFERCILRAGAVVGYRDEPFGKLVFAAAAHVEVADDRERQRTDEVDEQILHRIQQTNVQIPAQPQCGLGAVRLHDDDVGDVFQHSGRIAARGVQHDGADRVDDGVLLHIEEEQLVHRTLKKFPDDADGHREAERHDGQIQRR